MKDRIKQLMDSKHMNQLAFSQYVGISTASLSSIFNGRTNPSLKIVEAIKSKFPTLNTDWLMFGTGEMFKAGSNGNEGVSLQNGDVVVKEGDADHSGEDRYEGGADMPISFTAPDGSPLTSGGGNDAYGNSLDGERQASKSSPIPPYNNGRSRSATHSSSGLADSRSREGATSNTPSPQIIIKEVEKKVRKIVEIRIFFDDNTYEAFIPKT